MARSPLASGALVALASAIAFGVTTPFVRRFGGGLGPFTTAFLLYAGAAAASLLGRRRADGPVRTRHLPRLALVAVAGAVVAPVCLAWGLQRTSATSASLLLNLEAVFTVLLARAFFREPIGARVAIALGLMVISGSLLVLDGAADGAVGVAGLAAVVVATFAWAADNALSRPLAALDPMRVVATKASLGALLTLGAALIAREPMPGGGASAALLVCGALGYGVSLRLYLLAQRRIGAARTASVFAVAPFVGAAVAWILAERPGGWTTLGAGALFAAAVALHVTERHGHEHRHEAEEHEHPHRHDDAHHSHAHDPPVTGEHSHAHRHEPQSHVHEHAPDVHHEHRH